jgi:hypothetical protein
MSVDVEIYMSNIIKFFRENPKDLLNLVPKEKEDDFYVMVREVANKNFEKGIEITLTQKQFIEICKELNQKQEKPLEIPKGFIASKFGLICLN